MLSHLLTSVLSFCPVLLFCFLNVNQEVFAVHCSTSLRLQKGENGLKCQRNNSKNKAFSLQTNVKSCMKKSKDCGGGKTKNIKEFLFFGGT